MNKEQQSQIGETIRQSGVFRCVKLKSKYYCVGFNEATGEAFSFVPADRIVGEFRTAKGWTPASIVYVAKGRTKKTAVVYFNDYLRGLKKKRSKVPDPSSQVPEQVPDPVECDEQCDEGICPWCNGSGQDPRNIQWSCAKC